MARPLSAAAASAAGQCWPALIAVLLMLAGCARTPPPVYYVLAPPVAPAAGTMALAGDAIGLGPLRFPDYLDRPQIVLRATPNRLVLAERERWAEPLAQAAARALQQSLAARLPGTPVRLRPWRPEDRVTREVAVDVQRLDVGPDRELILAATWRIKGADDRGRPLERASTIRIPVATAGDPYEILAAAHGAALAALADQIALALGATAPGD